MRIRAVRPAFVGDRYQRGHGLGSMLSERTNSTRGRTFPEKTVVLSRECTEDGCTCRGRIGAW